MKREWSRQAIETREGTGLSRHEDTENGRSGQGLRLLREKLNWLFCPQQKEGEGGLAWAVPSRRKLVQRTNFGQWHRELTSREPADDGLVSTTQIFLVSQSVDSPCIVSKESNSTAASPVRTKDGYAFVLSDGSFGKDGDRMR